jgi:hypothetical protein
MSIESQQIVHDYGKIHDDDAKHYGCSPPKERDGIACLETTSDNKWLIIRGDDKHVKRISIEN